MKHPFLSIIIPCYNLEDYIQICINSIHKLEQIADCEILFIDDGSTDNTLSIIKNFVTICPYAKVISQPNKGVSAARNTGIELASGEWILFLDGDDFLEKDSVNIIKQSVGNCDLIIPNIIFTFGNKEIYQSSSFNSGLYTPTELFKICTVFPTAPMNIYKTSIIKSNCLRFNHTLKVCEVYNFTIEYLLHCNFIKVIDRYIYHYVMRTGSATHKPNFSADLTIVNAIGNLYQYANSFGNSDSYFITLFKLAMSFTYNKYLKNELPYKKVSCILQPILRNEYIKSIIHKTSRSHSASFKDQLLATYLRFLPLEIGYRLLYHIILFLHIFSRKTNRVAYMRKV